MATEADSPASLWTTHAGATGRLPGTTGRSDTKPMAATIGEHGDEASARPRPVLQGLRAARGLLSIFQSEYEAETVQVMRRVWIDG